MRGGMTEGVGYDKTGVGGWNDNKLSSPNLQKNKFNILFWPKYVR